jgi:hypothetical protein
MLAAESAAKKAIALSFCFLPAHCRLSDLPEQPAEGGELVARIQAAGVRQDPEPRLADALILGAEAGLRLSKAPRPRRDGSDGPLP